MTALRCNTQIALFSLLVLAVPLRAATQKSDTSSSCETPATKTACETSCSTTETASKATCGTSCTHSTEVPVCAVSGTSCGAPTPVDFDPALRAATGGSRRTAVDLGLHNLDELLEPVRAKYRVPALAIAVARSDGVFAAGAVGVRVAGGSARVTATDRFHLGSCGKSITASVAARLVERGQITWDTTIGDVFGDYPEAARSVYGAVTLEQLLAHRSGLPQRDDAVMKRVWALEGDTNTQRGEFVRMALQLPQVADPGSMFLYTDVGYTVAGVMLERAAGKAWEELVEAHIATPLRLRSLGFGEPASPGTVDQPWGHVAHGSRTVPFSPGPYAEMDNPAVIGPAGLVHLSIVDWGTYASEHLKGARKQESVMLAPDTYRVLHTNVKGQNYGLGWGVLQSELGRTLSHTGSCGEWFSTIKIVPDVDLAIVVATNVSGGNGVAACNDALQAVQAQYAAPSQ